MLNVGKFSKRTLCVALSSLALLSALPLCSNAADNNSSSAEQPKPPEISLANSSKFDLKSARNGLTYNVSVFLPASYYKSDTRYPVLYVLDGQIFGPLFAMNSRLLRNDIGQVIVVGIDSKDETFHWQDLPTAGPDRHWNVEQQRGAENFLKIISTEIKTRIDQSFRTKPDDSGLMGHSLGGFFALYAGLNSNLFSHIYASSPSLIWQNNILAKQALALGEQCKQKTTRLFIDKGGLEIADDTFSEMENALKSCAYPASLWHMETTPNQTHVSVVLTNTANALYAIYGPLPRQVDAAELASIVGTYQMAEQKTFQVVAQNGHVYLDGYDDEGRVEILTSEPNKWFIRYLGRKLTFHVNPSETTLDIAAPPTPGPNGDFTKISHAKRIR